MISVPVRFKTDSWSSLADISLRYILRLFWMILSFSGLNTKKTNSSKAEFIPMMWLRHLIKIFFKIFRKFLIKEKDFKKIKKNLPHLQFSDISS